MSAPEPAAPPDGGVRGARVIAIDAAEGMVARIRARARDGAKPVRAAAMDAQALALADGACDAALSVFGIILCPDPVRALREMGRVVRPGGPLAVVTWTEPQNYELVSRLIAAVTAVRGTQAPPAEGPAQLRFREEATLRALFGAAEVPSIASFASRRICVPGPQRGSQSTSPSPPASPRCSMRRAATGKWC